jgi:hypothetical protein
VPEFVVSNNSVNVSGTPLAVTTGEAARPRTGNRRSRRSVALHEQFITLTKNSLSPVLIDYSPESYIKDQGRPARLRTTVAPAATVPGSTCPTPTHRATRSPRSTPASGNCSPNVGSPSAGRRRTTPAPTQSRSGYESQTSTTQPCVTC